ncbi:MAG: GTP 3',8-cyclase MoaA [Crenarchaeota archaeon]|nr:GTP 3',8-cyclase MoaA [Thermoproteota archaeon]
MNTNNIIDRVRIKVTDRCNYRCFFCHHEGSQENTELTLEEIEFALEVFKELGIDRVKITGGEPLLRRDVIEIVRRCRELNYRDISLTTNGYYLDNYVEDLYKAGLHRIDISLHTLNPQKYVIITGTSAKAFYKVLDNIYKTCEIPFKEVKINMLVTSLNVEDIPELLRFCKKLGTTLQLIEYMPIGKGVENFRKYYIPLKTIFEILKRRASKIEIRNDLHNRPILYIDNVKIEFVMGFRNPEFCKGCRQIRLTADGKLRLCIYRKTYIDVRKYLATQDEEGLINAYMKLLEIKKPMFTS